MVFKADEKYVNVHGRTLVLEGIRYIDYSLSGTAFTFTGKSVKARLTSDFVPAEGNDIFMPYCGVIVDGVMTKRFMVDKPEAEYELYSCDTEKTVEIELVKMSECAFGKVGIVEFITDSDIPPVPTAKKSRRLEFVGDSITCGYGIEGIVEKDVFNTHQENPCKAYAAQTAGKLDADFNLISWSGIGIISSWVPDDVTEPLTNWLSPVLYPYTDAALCNDKKITPFVQWDFDCYKPDVIVINLGTNDDSWTKGIPEREEEFTRLACDYLALIREKNPDAEIVYAFGAMLDRICGAVENAVNKFASEKNDSKVHYMKFTTHDRERDGMGADYHPSQVTHDRMADELSEYISKLMGWDIK